MTEREWLACSDPQQMLTFLSGKVSERRLRLFGAGCSRRYLHLTHDPRVSEALDVAELFADGLVSDVERSNARKAAQQAAQVRGIVARPDAPKWERRAASLAYYATARQAMEAAWGVPQLAVAVLVCYAGGYNTCDWQAIQAVERVTHCELLRDIFGNPFRPLVVNPSWLVWNDRTAVKLAQGIYEERAFDRMPILGDAIEEAGCDNADILGHCRSSGPHVRGCWVVDLILMKE